MAIALRVIYGRTGQTIAADGTLQEAFWTIPLTFFFALCALASFSIGFVGWKAYRRR